MNLQSQITEIRRRIAEPYPEDQEDALITDDEILQWIGQAELQVLYDVSADALAPSLVSALADRALPAHAGAFPNSLTLPSNFVRPVSVGRRSTSAGPVVPCRIVSIEEFRWAKSNPSYRSSQSQPVVAFAGREIFVSPTLPASNSAIELFYILRPERRYRHFSGSVTAKTTNNIWADLKAIPEGWPNDYFNLCGLRYTSGEPRGQEVSVSDYVGATGTFTIAATAEANPPDVNVGDSFEVGQSSELPERLEGPMMEYATYLCLCKDRDELAQKAMAEYQRQVKAINESVAVYMTPRR